MSSRSVRCGRNADEPVRARRARAAPALRRDQSVQAIGAGGLRDRQRGQAFVELAIGLLVFITVLIAAVHFGELAHLGLKVHESAASAAWDSTSYRVERPGPEGSPGAWYDTSRIAEPLSNTQGADRYDNWDGRPSRLGVGAPTQLYTQADPMEARCSVLAAPRVEFRIRDTAVTPAYGDPAPLSCTSTGVVNTVNIPSGFHQDSSGGFFKAPHLRQSPMTLCAFGRATGGTCAGSVPLLLGDHGLTSGNNENNECERRPSDQGAFGASCRNPTFYQLAHENWDRSRPWSPLPDQFADDVTGRYPRGKVTGFYMSYRGELSGFGEPGDNRYYQTTPMDHSPGGSYRTAYTAMTTTAAGDGMGFLYAGRYRCD